MKKVQNFQIHYECLLKWVLASGSRKIKLLSIMDPRKTLNLALGWNLSLNLLIFVTKQRQPNGLIWVYSGDLPNKTSYGVLLFKSLEGNMLIKYVVVRTHSPQNFSGTLDWNNKALPISYSACVFSQLSHSVNEVCKYMRFDE